MPIYDLPGGVIMTPPPLDASMAFYPLDLQGLIYGLEKLLQLYRVFRF